MNFLIYASVSSMFRVARQDFLSKHLWIYTVIHASLSRMSSAFQHIDSKTQICVSKICSIKYSVSFRAQNPSCKFSCPYFKVHLYLSSWSCVMSVPGRDMLRHITEGLHGECLTFKFPLPLIIIICVLNCGLHCNSITKNVHLITINNFRVCWKCSLLDVTVL